LVPFQKKGLENRSSRFEPKNSWLSFSRGSGPPLKIKSVRTNERTPLKKRGAIPAFDPCILIFYLDNTRCQPVPTGFEGSLKLIDAAFIRTVQSSSSDVRSTCSNLFLDL